jgi:hypothetical protein
VPGVVRATPYNVTPGAEVEATHDGLVVRRFTIDDGAPHSAAHRAGVLLRVSKAGYNVLE